MGETAWGGNWVLFWWAGPRKSLIQFSIDGRGYVPSLLFDLRPNYGVGNEHNMVKAMVFPVVVYGCEGWTKKKAECWRIDAFELWCWRRLLRVPWTTRRSNQSILKEISPEYLLEGLVLNLKSNSLATWCKELTHWRQEEKGSTEDEMVGWCHWLNGHEFQ